MLLVKDVCKSFFPGTINEKIALKDVTVEMQEGEFVTLIGKWCRKVYFAELCSRCIWCESGSVYVDDIDVTRLPEHKRLQCWAGFSGSDDGTAANMGIEENLALAYRRGEKRLEMGITARKGIVPETSGTPGAGAGRQDGHKSRPFVRRTAAGATLLMATLKNLRYPVR